MGMLLKDYLAEVSVTYDEFAKRIGVANAGVVAKYVTGRRTPRARFMSAITRETGGKVQPNDFFPLVGE